MEERREISRVEYKTNGVVVICDTQEKIYVDVKDISPLGMGICVPIKFTDDVLQYLFSHIG